MSQTPRISIIANFYNSEKYIPKLIKSVLKQSFQDWELIAVNDCSPGNDLKVLEKYAALPEMHGRMRIIDNKENQGISRAKQTGIMAAKAEFLTFIDGDDWFEPLALEKMYEAITINNADIIVANGTHSYRNIIKRAIQSTVIYEKKYNREEIISDLLISFFGVNLFSSVGYWGKLFRRDLILKSEFSPRETVLAEDLFFNLYYLLVANSVVFIDYPAYNWRWGGISSGSSKRKEQSFAAMAELHHFNDFYFERKKIAEQYNLERPIVSLRIELYNVLRCTLCNICCYKNDKQRIDAAKRIIEEAISLPAYKDILILRGNPYIKDQTFFDALESHDLDWLYNFFHEIYRQGWKRRLIHRILSIF